MRYAVKQDIMEIPCEHPKCEQLHERFFNCQDTKGNWFHLLRRKEWSVINLETGFAEYTDKSKVRCIKTAELMNRIHHA